MGRLARSGSRGLRRGARRRVRGGGRRVPVPGREWPQEYTISVTRRRAPARSGRTRLSPCRIPAAPEAVADRTPLAVRPAWDPHRQASAPSRPGCAALPSKGHSATSGHLQPPPLYSGRRLSLTIPHTPILYPAFAARQVGVCPHYEISPRQPGPPPEATTGKRCRFLLLSDFGCLCPGWLAAMRPTRHTLNTGPAAGASRIAVRSWMSGW